ncbi:hypothetical protein SDC9_134080 [bioreactor metagenome]|uniref:DUF1700 domain-containing protein n=1 Tax=bioreactor metagenome TaxID=1076179 RepID=A0A645DCN9_9ZZZZ|nr:DUF1700 domain-containing protein [Oscillospiraceae bacterium]
MKKNEFLNMLMSELKKNNVAETDDIISEYEQHFAFKIADGFSEEEISAKLGNPVTLASQFESNSKAEKNYSKKIPTIIGLAFADIFAGIFIALLFAWEAILASVSLSFAAISICLFGGFNIYSLIPVMPYGCGLIFALSLAALAVLAAAGCIYFALFVRQIIRAYVRFHHNAISLASGNAALPPLAIHPQLCTKTKRRIRSITLFSLAIFASCFVLGMIVSMLSSGALGFWHAWGWFVQ